MAKTENRKRAGKTGDEGKTDSQTDRPTDRQTDAQQDEFPNTTRDKRGATASLLPAAIERREYKTRLDYG